MPELSDVFALLYGTDLQTLRLVVEEAARVLAQREQESRFDPSTLSRRR